MLLSFEWLKELIHLDLSPDELAGILTMSGTEVEGVEYYGDWIKGVVVGEISTVDAHPNSSSLSVLSVDTGKEKLRVVAGIPGLKAGLKVGVARRGARLWNVDRIDPVEIRGVVSEGKLCSEMDVGVSDEEEKLLVLERDVLSGTDVCAYLKLGDPVFNLEITPNRGDCMSVAGIARELSTLTGIPVEVTPIALREIDDMTDGHITVSIEDPDGCGRYAARIVQGVSIGESPLWMKIRLKKIGLRPINNIVDATNYIMAETGHPLHAFDYDRLSSKVIVVRQSSPGEKFVTLDGEAHDLPPETVMITDGNHPVAIGGIMGGENSEVTDGTTRILLECAYFDPERIFDSSRRLHIASEASGKFSHGVDPERIPSVIDRAAALIGELSDGEVLKGRVDVYPLEFHPAAVDVRPSRVNKVLGTAIAGERMKEILSSLGCGVDESGEGVDVLTVVPPTFRSDLRIEEDFIEEIGRIHGYDTIEPSLPLINREFIEINRKDAFKRELRTVLRGMGFTEVITSSFSDERDLVDLGYDDYSPGVKIINSGNEEEGILRVSLIPSLLKVVSWNVNRKNVDLKLFEYGKIYLSNREKGTRDEREMLGAVLLGNRFQSAREYTGQRIDFFDVKGVVENLFHQIGIREWSFRQDCSRPYDSTQSARIFSARNREIGRFGALSRELPEKKDIEETIFAIELFSGDILSLIQRSTGFEPYSRYPASERDISLLVPLNVSCEDISKRIYEVNKELIKEVVLIDFYQGKQIPGNRKGMTFRIFFQSAERTLRDEEVDGIFSSTIDELANAFGIALRDR
jgi:phenylalanyl-tRNA synthetase beta chain